MHFRLLTVYIFTRCATRLSPKFLGSTGSSRRRRRQSAPHAGARAHAHAYDLMGPPKIHIENMICWGCGAEPSEGGRHFQRCARCRDEFSTSSYFCSKDCLNKHWPRHKAWHQQQRARAKAPATKPSAIEVAVDKPKDAVLPASDPFSALLAEAGRLMGDQKPSEAVQVLKRAAALRPDDPRPPFQLAMAHTACKGDDHLVSACGYALRAVELAPGGYLGVLPSDGDSTAVPRGIYPQIGLRAAITAFDLLIRPPCDRCVQPSPRNSRAVIWGAPPHTAPCDDRTRRACVDGCPSSARTVEGAAPSTAAHVLIATPRRPALARAQCATPLVVD